VKIRGKILEIKKKGDHATGFKIGHANGLILCLTQPNLETFDGMVNLTGIEVSKPLKEGRSDELDKPHHAGSPLSQFLSPCASMESGGASVAYELG